MLFSYQTVEDQLPVKVEDDAILSCWMTVGFSGSFPFCILSVSVRKITDA